MTKTMTNLLLMLITILAGTYFYVNYCSSCGGLAKDDPEPLAAPVSTEAPKPTSYPFAFGNGGFAYETNDNYNFNQSSYSILMPLTEKLLSGVDDLKRFLENNPGKVATITGYYTQEEENNSAYPNLGLARANAVKNHMVSLGIPSAQLDTQGELKGEMVADNGVFLGPIGYTLGDVSADESAELNALYEKIKANPLVLYFNTAQASIDLSGEQRQKVADISRYLDKAADATVNIVGHTDNTGLATTNMKLGLDRANFAKSYLMRNGIAEDRINTTSKGSNEPLESNATEDGRAKNRRTVITLN